MCHDLHRARHVGMVERIKNKLKSYLQSGSANMCVKSHVIALALSLGVPGKPCQLLTVCRFEASFRTREGSCSIYGTSANYREVKLSCLN